MARQWSGMTNGLPVSLCTCIKAGLSSVKPYAAYAIGAALVDTEIQVSDDELSSMGVEKGMMTLVDQARQADMLTQLSDHLIAASHASGGSAGNSMIATALMGSATYMSCKVADDPDGDIYLADLEQSGVAHGLSDRSDAGVTGKCIVLITPDAERSLNTHLGISETLSTDEVNAAAIRDSEWVYLEGYLVTSPTGHAAALKTKALAEKYNVRTAVSFSDPGMVKFFRDNMAAMVEGGVELVFCNEAEAMEWGQCDHLTRPSTPSRRSLGALSLHSAHRAQSPGTARTCIALPLNPSRRSIPMAPETCSRARFSTRSPEARAI
jgi:sugar/nucleoside kinase (ribokinase family)